MPALSSYLPHWLWPGDGRPRQEIDDEIAEELRLHVDLLAEDNERRGMRPDEARQAAEQRFGDFDLITRRCRQIKQGDLPMLSRIQVVLTGLLLIGVILLGVRQGNNDASTAQFMNQTTTFLQTINTDLGKLREQSLVAEQQEELITSNKSIQSATIRLRSTSGAPITGARLTVVWASASRDYFDFYDLTTNQQGEQQVELEYPNGGRAESVTVIADGYALVSKRLTRPTGYSEPILLTLQEAVEIPLQILIPLESDDPFSQTGELTSTPITAVQVSPVSRTDSRGKRYAWNHSGSHNLTAIADENGLVTVKWFAAGDSAQMTVKTNGGHYTLPRVEIPSTTDQPLKIVVTDAYRSGGGQF